jgi:hypothetical protein
VSYPIHTPPKQGKPGISGKKENKIENGFNRYGKRESARFGQERVQYILFLLGEGFCEGDKNTDGAAVDHISLRNHS